MTNMKPPLFAAGRVAGAVALALLGCQVGAATITADGKLDSDYQLGYKIGFVDDTGKKVGDGKLYFGINSTDNSQFLYFMMPKAYVDNRYGSYTVNAFGWTSKGHTFDDLLGSDSLGSSKGTTFQWNGNSATIDYIGGVGSGSCSKKKCTGSASDYRSGGMGTVDGDGVTDKNEGAVHSGSAASVLEIATSLEYNFDHAGTTTTDDGHTNANWIEEVGYEVQFKSGTFNANSWLDKELAYSTTHKLLTIGSPHASPSKEKFGGFLDPECIKGCTPPPAVPEPETYAMLLAGLGVLGALARKRKASLSA